MNIHKIVIIIIGVIVMGSFVVEGIHNRKTGNRTWDHPVATAIRLVCAFVLLVVVNLS